MSVHEMIFKNGLYRRVHKITPAIQEKNRKPKEKTYFTYHDGHKSNTLDWDDHKRLREEGKIVHIETRPAPVLSEEP